MKLKFLLFLFLMMLPSLHYKGNSLFAQMIPFACTQDSYQLSSNSLYDIDVKTGATVLIKNLSPSPLGAAKTTYNALGYDIGSNFMWASVGYGYIAKIDSNGDTHFFLVSGLPNTAGVSTAGGNHETSPGAGFSSGCMDLKGNIYFYNTQGQYFYVVNISGPTPVFVRKAQLGNGNGYTTSDWVFNQQKGVLQGVEMGPPHIIYSFNPVSGAVVGSPITVNQGTSGINLETNSGSAFSDVQGTLYIYGNTNHGLYQLSQSSPYTAIKIATLGALTNNDGANCPCATWGDLSFANRSKEVEFCLDGPSASVDIVLNGTFAGGLFNLYKNGILYRENVPTTADQTVIIGLTEVGEYTAKVWSINCNSWLDVNDKSIIKGVYCFPDLAVVKTVSNLTPVVGSNVTFTITATNNGLGTATGVSVADALPTGYTLVSATPSTGIWTSPNWTIGNLPNGASATLKMVTTVNALGLYGNTATIIGNEPDPTPANNTSTSTPIPMTPVASADLRVIKTVSNPTPAVGSNVTFTITVTNSGPNAASGVSVADVLPTGYTFVSATPSTGTWTAPNWTIGNLANGGNATLTMVATVNASGLYANTATITGNELDPIPADNTYTNTPSVINAVIDTFPTQTPSTTVPKTVGNVTTNDTLNGVPVTAANTDVTPVTAGPISIDANGVLTLAPNTPSGSYPITYNICEVNPVTGAAVNPSNCASVTDTVVVSNPINAVIDTFPTQTPSTTVPKTVGNVTTNDTLNGVPVTAANTDVTPVTAGPISIDANGVMTLAPNTPSGSYPITYNICEVNPVTGAAVNPSNCASVTDTVVVLNPINAVIDTFPTQTPSTTVPKTVGNVTTNDTLNGVPVTAENTDVTPVTEGPLKIDANGVLTLAPNTPSGSYPITYTICEVGAVPANCDSVTDTIVVLNPIDAVVDTFPTQTPGTTVPTTVGNVTTNDTLNGVPVTADNTDVTPVTEGPLKIDANGVLTLAPNTPSGSYPITYQICEVGAVPANCDSVTDTIVVLNPIDAVEDIFPTQKPSTTVPTTVGNVTDNDTLNGVPVTADNTDVTPVTAGPISIDATGVVTLAPNTPSGSYPITYTICEVGAVPANCDSVTDTIVVLNPIDAVVDTFPTQTPGTTVPKTVGNVTDNDTLNGVPVTADNTDVTPVTAGPISIDSTGVVTLAPNTPSGSYPITYTICEVNPATGLGVVPANCDSVTDTIVVLNPIDAVVDTFPTQTPSTTVPTTVGNVTTNDTLNGVPVTADNTDVTPVTAGPISIDATGVVTLAPNTPSGSYPITYTICEVNAATGLAVVPANCDSVTDTIVVLNPIDAVVDTFPTQTPGTTVPTTVGNVTTNDTLNGVPVTAENTDVTPVTEGPLKIDANGVLTLAPSTPSGSYPITYQICEVGAVPANCDSVTDTIVVLNPIDAVEDIFPTQTPSTTVPKTVGNVTTNDTLNGVPVTAANTDVTPVTAGPISIDANGVLTLAPNTPSGSYPITYTICEVNPATGLAVVPANCDSVTDTIVVLNPIDAVVDTFPTQTPGTTVPTTVGNVTTNDTLNGVPVTAENTDVTPVTEGPLKIDANGVLTLAPNTPSGSYPITYQICEVGAVPVNCDSVTDTIVVLNPIDAVADTFPTQTPGTTVPTTVGNVTTNDTLNGVPVTAENTDVTPVTEGPLKIDANGVLTLAPNTPSGSYPITYQICEVGAVPANCDSVTDTIVVLNPIDAVEDIFPTQKPSTTVPTTVGNVTTNDTLNGVPVTAANTDVTPVTAGPISIDATGVVTLAPNTPSGSYPITYTICEVNPATGIAVNPSNCDSATAIIVVLNPIDAVNDTMLPTNGGLGNPTAGNVLTNDALNGKPVSITDVNLTVTNPAISLTSGAPVPVVDPATGIVSIPAGTPAGNYVITYQICEKLSSSNCDTATVTVPVVTPVIDAVDDDYTGIQIYSYPGGRTGTVLGNDTLNGNPIVLGSGLVKLTGITVPSGLTLNTDGTVSVSPNTASGTYILNYTICDVLNPTNCDSAIATIKVLAQNPSIALIKTAELLDENGDGLAQVGEKIRYNFKVTNTGDVPLTNITIKDPLPGIVMSGGPISLLPGESDSTSFTGTYTITAQDLNMGSVSNQATVLGTSPRGIIVTDLSDNNSNAKDEATVLTINGCKIEVFNLVSPNGDGANDYLHIEGLDCYPKNSVEIYNRWGVLVYSAEGYNNNEISFKGFSDGRVTIKQSEGLPDGTYYYILKFTDFEGRILSKAGYLYLTK